MPRPLNERQSLEQERAELSGQVAAYRQELENGSPHRARRELVPYNSSMPVRDRQKYERRWLRAGRCAVCGKRRAKKTRRFQRGSKRFCPAHLVRNREYQARYRASRR